MFTPLQLAASTVLNRLIVGIAPDPDLLVQPGEYKTRIRELEFSADAYAVADKNEKLTFVVELTVPEERFADAAASACESELENLENELAKIYSVSTPVLYRVKIKE